MFNISGLSITRYVNALYRAICDVTRTLIIWVVGLIVTSTVGVEQANYRWESTTAGSIGLQALGFVILILGSLVYNGIVSNSWLRDEKEKEEQLISVSNSQSLE